MAYLDLTEEITLSAEVVRDFLDKPGLQRELLGKCNFNRNNEEAIDEFSRCKANNKSVVMFNCEYDSNNLVVTAEELSKITGLEAEEIEPKLEEIIVNTEKTKILSRIKKEILGR